MTKKKKGRVDKDGWHTVPWRQTGFQLKQASGSGRSSSKASVQQSRKQHKKTFACCSKPSCPGWIYCERLSTETTCKLCGADWPEWAWQLNLDEKPPPQPRGGPTKAATFADLPSSAPP